MLPWYAYTVRHCALVCSADRYVQEVWLVFVNTFVLMMQCSSTAFYRLGVWLVASGLG
jgi:hypothetical protein